MPGREIFVAPNGVKIRLPAKSPRSARKTAAPHQAAPAAAPAAPAAPAAVFAVAVVPAAVPVVPAARAREVARRINALEFLQQLALDPVLSRLMFRSPENEPEADAEPAPLPPLDPSGRLPRVPLRAETTCVVCADAAPSLCAYPCGHLCVCCECVIGLRSRGMKKCSICRAPCSGYVLAEDIAN
jgi:hypothetical protein